MSPREFINRHQVAALSAAGVLIALSVGFLLWGWSTPSTQEPEYRAMTYYYDLEEQQLIRVDPKKHQGRPIYYESGSLQGKIKAAPCRVWSCGRYTGQPQSELTILMEVAAEYLPEGERPPGVEYDPETESGGFVIRRPQDDRWYNPNSAAGRKITRQLHQGCDKPVTVRAVPEQI